MTENIFLRVAGFSIKINFIDPGDYSFSKKKLKGDVSKYLKGFIHGQGKINDFKIEIKQKIDNDVIYKKKDKSFYFKIFDLKKGQINCNYEISFSQMSFIIRHVILQLLSKNNGFLMHGSAVAIKDKAYIFTGPSGAGKSTIMKMLNAKYPALADDSIIIKKERGQYYFYQTPIIEKESWVKKQSKKYPLGGIFFLNKSKSFKIDKISDKKKIVTRLISQLFVNQDETAKQVNSLVDFIKKFDRFNMISFSKNQKKLFELFSKNIV
jgi:hypothetical protein